MDNKYMETIYSSDDNQEVEQSYKTLKDSSNMKKVIQVTRSKKVDFKGRTIYSITVIWEPVKWFNARGERFF